MKKTTLTRREFLKRLAVSLGGMALLKTHQWGNLLKDKKKQPSSLKEANYYTRGDSLAG